MVAYLYKIPGGKFELKIVAAPCNGEEYNNGERIIVAGKREANAICKARGVKPWNF